VLGAAHVDGRVAEARVLRRQHLVGTGTLRLQLAERFAPSGETLRQVLLHGVVAGPAREAAQLGVHVHEGTIRALGVAPPLVTHTRIFGEAFDAVRQGRGRLVLGGTDGLSQIVLVSGFVLIQTRQVGVRGGVRFEFGLRGGRTP
ncbi:MAG: hypothetical protein ABEI52_01220, partial [Halobacteriaceae archaeon]